MTTTASVLWPLPVGTPPQRHEPTGRMAGGEAEEAHCQDEVDAGGRW